MKVLFWLAIPLISGSIPLSAQQLGRTAGRANFHPVADIPDQPAVKWQFKTNGKVLSSPVVNGSNLFIGSTDSCMYALDRTTGTQRWKYKTNGAVNSSVACDSSAVYFLSEDGFLHAVVNFNGNSAPAAQYMLPPRWQKILSWPVASTASFMH